MSNADPQRGNGNRTRPNSPSFKDNKSPNYSPSASYNYNPSGQVNYQTPQQNNQNQHQPQHSRRRNDRHKKENSTMTDRLAKQNDVIIRLLKEIRDRLPQPGQGGGQNAQGRPYKRRVLRDQDDHRGNNDYAVGDECRNHSSYSSEDMSDGRDSEGDQSYNGVERADEEQVELS
ncbi:MAG: hypothetical protein GF344_05420 [Chitinivibrionales bacterium]|nr:hypothetical protein [Chitinivibrionales bacterium]MBD3356416.1 hypothetical protein [Chitinivibrionales bacterium]